MKTNFIGMCARAGCLFVIGFVMGVSAVQAQTSGKARPEKTAPLVDGQIVILPKLEVLGERIFPPPETFWTYSRYQNFEVLADLSVGNTKKFVRYFGEFVNTMQAIYPPLRSTSSIPFKIILTDRNSVFRQFSNTWFSTMRTYRDSEQVVFIINLDGDMRRDYESPLMVMPDYWDGATGLLAREPDASSSYAEMDPSVNVGMDAHAPRFSSFGFGPTHAGRSFFGPKIYTESDPMGRALRQLQNAYMQVYFDKLEDMKLPRWFEFALRRLLSDVEIWKKNAFVGKDTSSFQWMYRYEPLPMAQIFGDERPAGAGRSGILDMGRRSSQSYAFVHYCLYRRGSKLKEGFARFLAAACSGPVDEALFKQCFGMSYRQMEWALKSYAGYADMRMSWYKFKDDPYPAKDDVFARAATEAEVGRMKGETFLLLGNKFAAQRELFAPYIRKKADAELLGALGLHLMANGNPEKARRLLDIAFENGVTRARVCLALANLRMAAAQNEQKKAHGSDAKLTVAEMESVLRPLSTALGQRPVQPAAYLLLSEAWNRSAVPPKAVHLSMLSDGCRMFPTNLELLFRTATVQAENGFKTDARKLVEQGIRISKTTRDRDRFEALGTRISDAGQTGEATQRH